MRQFEKEAFSMALFRNCVGYVILMMAVQVSAQSTTPRFEVVSIRLVPANTPPTMRSQDFTPILPGGQYIHSRAELFEMISFAYQVRNYAQLVGLPNWARNQSYSVAAKPADGFPALSLSENREQVRLMLRAMLADRFHLRIHTETRQEPVLDLVTGNGGMKIKEVDPPVPPDSEGRVNAAVGDAGGRMIARKATMAGLAVALAIFLKRPVVDQTGLKGYYDFDVRWSAEEPHGQPTPGLGAEGEALLISSLQSQFGLRLMKALGAVEYWVVDHVEPPTDN
jgi:uncharacterized protein (TIGR03435 family)